MGGMEKGYTDISATLIYVSRRNVTLVLPDDLVRKAKVLAAQRETTLSGLVGSLLTHALGDVIESGLCTGLDVG